MKLTEEDAKRVVTALRAYARLLELVQQETREENYKLHRLASDFQEQFLRREIEVEEADGN